MRPGSINRVLIVDDDAGVLARCRMQLERAGIDAATTTSAASARQIAQTQQFDLVIFDFWLGTEPAVDAIADVRARQPQAWLVVWTGYVGLDHSLLQQLGVDRIVAKPSTPREVIARIEGRPSASLPLRATPSLERAKVEHVFRVLDDTGGNVSEAARRLKITRQALQRFLKERTTEDDDDNAVS